MTLQATDLTHLRLPRRLNSTGTASEERAGSQMRLSEVRLVPKAYPKP